MMSVTSYTLIQIKGMGLEALFSGRRYKILTRERNGRVFLDINTKCFGAVVDLLVFLINHENPLLEYIVSLRNISCSP